MTARAADVERRWLVRAGGLSGIGVALVYVLITALYVAAGQVPTDVEARLAYHAANEGPWWAILWLSVITDVLYVPVAVALCLALAPVNRTAVLAGAGLLGLFVVLDLAITWPNYAALLTLSGQLAAATSDALLASVIDAARYPLAIVDSSLLAAYIILVPGLGILLIGLVTRGSTFGRAAVWLGVATGLTAVLAVVGPFVYEPLGAVAILTAVLTLIWLFVVGLRLLQLEGVIEAEGSLGA